jgi:hypothetical protein
MSRFERKILFAIGLSVFLALGGSIFLAQGALREVYRVGSWRFGRGPSKSRTPWAGRSRPR